jgi:hypothetical protein
MKTKGLTLTSLLNSRYNILKDMTYFVTNFNKQDLHSSIIETDDKEYCHGTMNIYFMQEIQEHKRISGIPWHGLVLHKMLNIDCLCYTCQVYQITKKDRVRKKYGLLSPKTAESDMVTLVHSLWGSGESIYNKKTIQNKLSFWTQNRSSIRSQTVSQLS